MVVALAVEALLYEGNLSGRKGDKLRADPPLPPPRIPGRLLMEINKFIHSYIQTLRILRFVFKANTQEINTVFNKSQEIPGTPIVFSLNKKLCSFFPFFFFYE